MKRSVGNVQHLFVAAHRGAPMQSVMSVDAIAGQGLTGDRYMIAGNRRSADYQVTLIERENIDAFCRDTGLPLSPDMPRRNIVTRCVRLNDFVGKRFAVGAAILEGVELCEPCNLMAKRTHREVLRYFIGKGGLRARILSGGLIQIDDGLSTS